MNDDSTEKRMAGDYEIIQAVHIGDRVFVNKKVLQKGVKKVSTFNTQ